MKLKLMAAARSERGSALLISLVLVFVMTLLGLALFDLGAIESGLMLANQTDAQAFEVAQAGIERALERLLRTALDEVSLANGPDFSNGNTTGATTINICTGGPSGTGGCEQSQFRPVNTGYSNNTSFAGGSYTIQFKLVSVAEANGNPYGLTCLQAPAPNNTLCANLIFVRSTGTVSNVPPGYSKSRTIQVIARAENSSALGGGVVAGSPSGSAMNGNVRIAGSIHILGDPGTAALSFGGSAGQRNNWEDLDSTSLSRLTPLQLVCPPGRQCPPGATVESLGATLKIARPITTPAVVLSGGTTLGESGDSGSYGSPARVGKGPLDGVFVADGCAMPCADNFSGVTLNSNIFVDGDNITRPYPGTPAAFPLLTDPVKINGISYVHYACPAGSTCFEATQDPTRTTEFFKNHAGDVTAALAGTLGSAAGLKDNTAAFTVTPIPYYNKAGVSQTGQICWQRTTGARQPPANTLEFGNPSCDTPSTAQNPLLIYMNSGFKVERQGGATPMNYRGVAIVLATGLVKIEEILQTSGELISAFPGGVCPAAPVNCVRKFPEHDMLTLLTINNAEVGKDNSNIDRIMGMFYTGCLSLPCSTTGNLYSQKQTDVLGGAVAWKFCFSGGCGDSGGNVPRFFQVSQDLRALPEEMFIGSGNRWSVTYVPGFWMECRPGTLPPNVSGVCGYQQ